MLNREIGRRIGARRAELRLSAGQLEADLNLPRGAMGRMERGERGLDAGLLIALADALDVGVDYFFTDLPPIAGQPGVAARPPEIIAEIERFLIRFHAIIDDVERQRLLALVRAVADSDDA